MIVFSLLSVYTFGNKIPCQIAENSFFAFMFLAMPGKHLLLVS